MKKFLSRIGYLCIGLGLSSPAFGDLATETTKDLLKNCTLTGQHTIALIINSKLPDVSSIYNVVMETVFNDGRFTIVDRTNLETLLQEQSFQITDFVDTSTAVKIGKLANVKLILIVGVSVDLVHLRIVNVENGQIVSFAVEGSAVSGLSSVNKQIDELIARYKGTAGKIVLLEKSKESDLTPLFHFITKRIVRSDRFEVFERYRLLEVMEEQNLQQSDFFDTSTAVKAGKFMGADTLLLLSHSEQASDVKILKVENGVVLGYKNLGRLGRKRDSEKTQQYPRAQLSLSTGDGSFLNASGRLNLIKGYASLTFGSGFGVWNGWVHVPVWVRFGVRFSAKKLFFEGDLGAGGHLSRYTRAPLERTGWQWMLKFYLNAGYKLMTRLWAFGGVGLYVRLGPQVVPGSFPVYPNFLLGFYI